MMCFKIFSLVNFELRCMYGCTANLEDTANDRLMQIKTLGDCREWCSKVMNEPLVVEEIEDVLSALHKNNITGVTPYVV